MVGSKRPGIPLHQSVSYDSPRQKARGAARLLGFVRGAHLQRALLLGKPPDQVFLQTPGPLMVALLDNDLVWIVLRVA